MCDTLGNGGLAYARLADKDRVILRSTRKNLQHSAALLIATNNWIELASAGKFVEVYRILAKSIELLVVGLGIDCRTFAKLAYGLKEIGLGNALSLK